MLLRRAFFLTRASPFLTDKENRALERLFEALNGYLKGVTLRWTQCMCIY